MTNTKEESRRIKSSFVTYFDEIYGISPIENRPDTYHMGVCKLEYKDNTLTVHLRRPGLLIGYHGQILDALSKHLKCKIIIKEVNLIK